MLTITTTHLKPGLPAAQRRPAQRQGAAHRALDRARRVPDHRQRARGSGHPHRAAGAQPDVVPRSRAARRPLPLRVRAGSAGRAGHRAAPPAGDESRTCRSTSNWYAVPAEGAARRRRDALPGVPVEAARRTSRRTGASASATASGFAGCLSADRPMTHARSPSSVALDRLRRARARSAQQAPRALLRRRRRASPMLPVQRAVSMLVDAGRQRRGAGRRRRPAAGGHASRPPRRPRWSRPSGRCRRSRFTPSSTTQPAQRRRQRARCCRRARRRARRPVRVIAHENVLDRLVGRAARRGHRPPAACASTR